MDASVLATLLGGIAVGATGSALWFFLRALGEVFDLATGDKEIEA